MIVDYYYPYLSQYYEHVTLISYIGQRLFLYEYFLSPKAFWITFTPKEHQADWWLRVTRIAGA